MIHNEAFDYLWNQLANGTDAGACAARLKDYQRKRLRRALLGRAIKPYFLEAVFESAMDADGSVDTAQTQGTTQPLLVLDGAIRTSQGATTTPNNNNFSLQLLRSGGDARVQILQDFIKDEHLLTPFQCAIRPTAASSGQGAPWPLTWPVPIRLLPNEVIQVKATVLPSGVADIHATWCQFRAVMVNNQKEDDALVRDLGDYIAAHSLQRPVFLVMASDDVARSITLPAIGTFGQVEAKTKEVTEHLLVTGYAALFARTRDSSENGPTCNPQWRLQSSEGHTFSRELTDLQTFAYAQPDGFWQAFPVPFLLPKGSSLSALFNIPEDLTLNVANDPVADATERHDNYVIFRCVTV